MKMKFKIPILLLLLVVIFYFLNFYIGPILISQSNSMSDDNKSEFLAAASRPRKVRNRKNLQPQIVTLFNENFSENYVVKEAGSIEESKSLIWWISSGAYLYSSNGVGSTILGQLSSIDPWRIAFSISNPLDTDNGYNPQNIFRLVQKGQWQNFRQEAYFRILNSNLSSSPNRNASNGLLFFNHYQDAFNLYYTGIRVDGYAVIKKKTSGTYYTLAYNFIYEANTQYNRDTNPNLIPSQKWIGLRSEITTNSDNTVDIKLYIDKDKTSNWVLVAEAKDDGKSYGGAAITGAGYAGIRTDFMDVEFDDYEIRPSI